jgi:hypothetical protein
LLIFLAGGKQNQPGPASRCQWSNGLVELAD